MITASPCTSHNITLEPTSVLSDRFERLMEWPYSYGDAVNADPRCGCGEDGEGARCEWDDTDAIEDELSQRKDG